MRNQLSRESIKVKHTCGEEFKMTRTDEGIS